MKTGLLAIFDLEEQYAYHLLDYISEKQGMPFRTVAFTDMQEMKNYLNDNYVDLLLISADSFDESIADFSIGKIILLSNGNVYSEYIDYSSIYKYQSTENIIREVLDYYVNVNKDAHIMPVVKENVEIIGAYSPIGRCGKTTFAIALGQCLAEEHQVLYMNFEEFSGFGKMLDTGFPGDLSDLMYFYMQNPDSIAIKLKAIVGQLQGMDYVPPLVYQKDLREIDAAQWARLIKHIAATSEYDKIIIDLGNMVSDIFEMLSICNVVYVPGVSDPVQRYKLDSFLNYIEDDENFALKDRVVEVDMSDNVLKDVDITSTVLATEVRAFVGKYINGI